MMSTFRSAYLLPLLAVLAIAASPFITGAPHVELFGQPISVLLLTGVLLALGRVLYIVFAVAPQDRRARDARNRL